MPRRYPAKTSPEADPTEGPTKKAMKPVYGVQPVLEALEAGRSIDKLLCKSGPPSEGMKEVLQKSKERGIPVQKVPAAKLERIVHQGNHQGVIALIAAIPFAEMQNVVSAAYEAGEAPLLLALDGITDVRNFGAIARTAECAGVHGLVVPARGSAYLGADALRTSAGALNYLNVCRESSLPKALEQLRGNGLEICGISEHGQESLFQAPAKGPRALVMGAEDQGLSPAVWEICDRHLRIPMEGQVLSLNVSTAAAVALFESVRQRQAAEEGSK